jgi:Protein of unknown function (DUF3306)
MSDEEFLARWSRRKREAKAVVNVPPPTEPAGTPNPAPPAAAENPPDAEVNLSSLPAIDSIDAATDITAFLRKGISQELSRAALRRAWTADPAIRDFVGLAENAWDFNDPNAMPGFGPLDCSAEQIDALVGRIVGGVRSAADSLATAVAEGKQDRQSNNSGRAALSESRPTEAVADLATGEELSRDEPSEVPAAVQAEPSETDRAEAALRRRTHGGALPR